MSLGALTQPISPQRTETLMEPFAVVCGCDEKYAQHTCVLLRSLLENNPKTSFAIFIIVPSNFPAAMQSMLTDSMPSGEHSLTFLPVCNESLISTLPRWGWVSYAVYYPLMIPDLLPAAVRRVLYLDADIVVTGDISDLLHIDMSQHPLAAALEPSLDESPEFRKKINLDQSIPYFNSGVMVLNLDRWRSENIGRRALDFLTAHPEYIVFHDQCALNQIIRGNFLILSKEWNFRTHLDASIERAKHARILHFSSENKPWLFMSEYPLKEEYWKYLKKTEWKNYVEPDRTLAKVVRKTLSRYFPKILSKSDNFAKSLHLHLSLFGIRGVARRAMMGLLRSTAIFGARLPRAQQSVLIRLGTMDVAEYQHVFIYDEYGFRLPPKASVIIDVGANIGMSAVYFSQRYPNAKIIAIEPEPNNFDVLSKNAALFPRIVPVHARLWNRDGFFSICDGAESGRKPASAGSVSSDILVPSLTLNTLLSEYGIEEIDLLKIDAKGAECEIFEDFSTWIDRVKVVCVELHDRFRPAFRDRFRPGCSQAFEIATADFPIKWQRGELTCAAREGAILQR